MWIFTKPLEQLAAADLQALITNGVHESVALDSPGRQIDDAATREMFSCLSGLCQHHS